MPTPDIPTSGDQSWKPGDLALCIKGGPLGSLPRDIEYPKAGAVYHVEGVVPNAIFRGPYNGTALVFSDSPPNISLNYSWSAERFRKINPLSDEEVRATRQVIVVHKENENVD